MSGRRSYPLDITVFYRAVVEELRDGEWKAVAVYGPYGEPGTTRDYGKDWAHDRYENGTRRCRRQKQVAVMDADDNAWISWTDID